MSHTPERLEKDCLNCGAEVQGRYCHKCGQENIVTKETFWGMVYHFFSDITHFDGKFFSTIKTLFSKPGFLSLEYMRGRRKAYLHPIRMYVFTSAFFFLVFFSLFNPKEAINVNGNEMLTQVIRDSMLTEAIEDLKKDSSNQRLISKINLLRDTAQFKQIGYADLIPYADDFQIASTFGGDYKTLAEYDSVQQSLPKAERHNWIKRHWNKRVLSLNEKYASSSEDPLVNMADIVLHKMPYVLFISLPIFALILKLLYFRHRRFYFADHGIFSIHHYILSFLLLLMFFGFRKLDKLTNWAIWDILMFSTIVAMSVYLYKAMKRFYGQNRFKTFSKFVLLNILGFITFLLIFICFFIFSIFQL